MRVDHSSSLWPRSLAVAAVAAATVLGTPLAAFADTGTATPAPDSVSGPAAGSTVTGTVHRGFVEHKNETDNGAATDFNAPLTWVQQSNGTSVRVPTSALATVATGSQVAVKVGNQVTDQAAAVDNLDPARQVLSTQVIAPAAPAPATTTAQATTATGATATDTVDIALVAPSGSSPDSTTLAQMSSAVSGPVSQFWATQSNGAVQLAVGNTYDWATTTADCSDPFALWNEVANKVGFTPGAGKHLLLYVPYTDGQCSYGLGTVGGSVHEGGYAYVQDTVTSVIAHELGHNMGLMHSGKEECQGAIENGTCSVDDYGNYYDVMGASWDQVGSLNAAQSARLGFLPAAQVQSLTTSDAGGTYTLAPLSATSGTRAIKLTAPSGEVYYLENRFASGQDSWLGSTSTNLYSLQSGVLINAVETASANVSAMLLDATPSSDAYYASDRSSAFPTNTAVSLFGNTFAVTVTGTTASGATVKVTTPATPTPPPAPTNVLKGPASLASQSSLYSASGAYRLTMQSDGNLVLYTAANKALWASGTNSPGAYLRMQGDGNLVIYTSDGATAVWASSTQGITGGYLTVGNDGTAVVADATGNPAWRSGSKVTNTLANGATLAVLKSITSPNNAYRLTVQSDGNLVEYAADGRALWATSTKGTSARLTAQTDGNIVLYDGTGKVLWATGTNPSTGTALTITNAGDLIAANSAGSAVWNHSGDRRDTLGVNQTLSIGEVLTSGNGGFKADLNVDGTFSTKNGVGAYWTATASAAGAHHLVMQSDGNLVLYNADNKAVWASGTPNHTGGHLVMQNDNNLVIYDGAGKAYWSTR